MAFTSLDSYRFLSCVCVGARTQLWQGYSTLLEIPVALKMPIDELKSNSAVQAELRWEYQVGKDIQHPKIVQMHDFLQEDGQTVIVLEWLPYRSLRSILDEGFESWAWRVPHIALDLAEAAAWFNSLGWVHRDISPDVFMVNEKTNEAKLVEFPYARRAHTFWSRPMGTGESRQSNPCISPEQICGEPLDERSDAYSLACILFELAAGVPPFQADSFSQLVHQHLNFPVPSADLVNPRITPEFARLLRQTMAKKPDERPASTMEFWCRLKEIQIFKTPYLPPKTSEDF